MHIRRQQRHQPAKERNDPVCVVNQVQVFDNNEQRVECALAQLKDKGLSQQFSSVTLHGFRKLQKVISIQRCSLSPDRFRKVLAEQAQVTVGGVDLVPG